MPLNAIIGVSEMLREDAAVTFTKRIMARPSSAKFVEAKDLASIRSSLRSARTSVTRTGTGLLDDLRRPERIGPRYLLALRGGRMRSK
jgi:hypothetical protein